MKAAFAFAVWALILPLKLMANPQVAPTKTQPPLVLCYHNIIHQKDRNPNDPSDTFIEDFQKQITTLLAEGYNSISLNQFYEARIGGTPLPPKSVLITFDDGYDGPYNLAVKFLHDQKVKATFFIYTDAINRPGIYNQYITHMSWQELQTLEKDPLFRVYSHTLTHPALDTLSLTQIERELSLAQADLVEHLGVSRPYLAYPFGRYDSRVVAIAKKYYRLAFSLDNETDSDQSNMYRWDRLGITQDINSIPMFLAQINRWLSQAQ